MLNNKRNLLALIFIAFFIIFSICKLFWGKDYDINMEQVYNLYLSEQNIFNKYILSIDNSYDVVNSDMSTDGVAAFSLRRDVNNSEIDSDMLIDNVENLAYLTVSDLTIVEFEEEFYVNNRVASRDLAERDVGSSDESLNQKLYRLFGARGQNLKGRCLYYSSNEEALKEMRTFTVTVWRIDSKNNWYKKNISITSHKALVKTLKCIFAELLELPEEDRVPIKNIGCYSYRSGTSAHSCGAALDINSDENAEMTKSGVVTAGRYWRPGEDIYSIKSNSPFVQIFEKYGWTWGGYWDSKKDYMHFSYIER